jgi:hypothetical protein
VTDNDNSNQLVIYPRLEGINYQEVVAHDGQICVVATGDGVRTFACLL